jgi:hypothetical protein
MKYKVTAIKNGKPVKIEKMEVNIANGEIFCIWYRPKNQLTWIFTKDLDEFVIEEIKQ